MITGNVSASAALRRRHTCRAACGVALIAILPAAACKSKSPGPTGPGTSASFSLSGRVFEVLSGAQLPAVDHRLFVRVLSTNCTAAICAAAQETKTGPDGRYSLTDLPGGRVVVTAITATHAQACGATAILSASTQLDVEISPRPGRPPSSVTPLRVSGQLFQNTSAGRVGVSRGEIALWLSLEASTQTTFTVFFLEVDADENGNYLACGLPANWPIQFVSGFEDYERWHQFGADATLDIERK